MNRIAPIALLIFLIGTFFFISRASEMREDVDHTTISPGVYVGSGESGISKRFLNMEIRIFEDDSVLMLGSVVADSLDSRKNNRQNFGRIIPNDRFTYEIQVQKTLTIDGCAKPRADLLNTDSISFFIDENLLEQNQKWRAIIKLDHTNDTLELNSCLTHYYLKGDHISQDWPRLEVVIQPVGAKVFQDVVVKSDLNCSVHIYGRTDFRKYYLNNNAGNWDLIWTSAPYNINPKYFKKISLTKQ